MVTMHDKVEYVRALSRRSVCKRRGVACLIFNNVTGDMVGWGVNGPANFDPARCSGMKDGCGCAHSEVNTLLQSHPTKKELMNRLGHMLATRAPCVPCATAIINSGYITKFTYLDKSEPGDAGLALLQECGIDVSHAAEYEDLSPLKISIIAGAPTVPCYSCGFSKPLDSVCPRCGAQSNASK